MIKSKEKEQKICFKVGFGSDQARKAGIFLGKTYIRAFFRVRWSLAWIFSSF
jgi:hypothetical protein